jgi:hypothetical protein
MKKIILASACVLALSMGGAFAQTQPAPGASSEGNVGPGASKGTRQGMTNSGGMKKGMTTGQGSGKSSGKSSGKIKGMSGDTSSEGNVGPGTSNNNAKQPGAR